MINAKDICLFVLLCTCFCSCKQKLTPSEYVAWVQDYKNGLHVKKTFSEFNLDIQYQPAEYVAINSNNKTAAQAPTLAYYTLRISMTDPSMDVVSHNAYTQQEKQQRLYYFSYLMQNDLYLEKRGQKIPCVLFHAEGTDLKKVKTFVLGFENAPDAAGEGETTFVIESQIFSSLPIRIPVTTEDIPTIDI